MSRGYRHYAAMYADTDQLLDTATPFLAEGVAAGEPLLLLCRDEVNAELVRALGPDARLITISPTAPRTASLLGELRRTVLRERVAGAPGVRAFGEMPPLEDEWGRTEWTRLEALCNVALADVPFAGVCAFGAATPEPTRSRMIATHPLMLSPGGEAPNPDYVDPATFLRSLPREAPEPVPGPPTIELTVDTLVDAEGLRRVLDAALTGPAPEVVADVVAAAHELADNALRHGRPPVRIRVWLQADAVTCEVTDQGPGFDDPLAGFGPAGAGGLALVRRAADRVHTRHGPDGFTVTLSSARVPEARLRA